MAIFKCKMCGANLNITEESTVVECEYCGSVQTVPKVDDEKKLTLFARANRLRFGCEFDKAAGVYEALVADFPEEAEAYWGLVLCKYGIEYVDDPATGKKIPTCHRSSFDSLMDDSDYEQTLENADSSARRVYRDEAKQIEEIRKGIIAVSANEEPYDIFICYKETAENGDRTLDSVLAQDVYDALTGKGYRVFFSRITLEDKLGVEYEPYIFAALNSAKIMLAFGTDYEYFNAVWVKNEWSRFLKLMAKDKEKHLIPCYKGIDAYDMPKEFAKLQAQDLGKVGATQDLLRGINKLLPQQQETVIVEAQRPVSSAMVMRGQFALDDGDWVKADEYFERALDENPQDGQAYLGKVLVGLRLSSAEQLAEKNINLDGDKNFERAIKFTTGAEKAKLEQIKAQADKNKQINRLIVSLKRIVKKKSAEEVFTLIEKYAAIATVESYEKIIKLCSSVYWDKSNPEVTYSLLESYTRQLDIIHLLASDYKEYTVENIWSSKYFNKMQVNMNVIREDLIKMMAAGSVEPGSSSGTYCLAGTRNKIIQKKNEEAYARAVACMSSANDSTKWMLAADLFAKLGDYLDSAERAAECLKKRQQLQDEMDRLEELHRQRRIEEERIAHEKREQAQRIAMQRRNAGRCQYCGGEFKGLFAKKCVNCGRPKDY